MASKPTTWTSGRVAAPNLGISVGRARGWEWGEYPLAEDTSRTSTSKGVRLKTEKQGRQGRPGDDYFGCSHCGDQGHRGSDCRVKIDWRNCWGRDFVASSGSRVAKTLRRRRSARGLKRQGERKPNGKAISRRGKTDRVWRRQH